MSLGRNVLLAGAGLLLLAVAAAPWLSGRLAEQQYWQALAGLETAYGDRLSVQGAYERGYRSGAGQTRLVLLPGEQRPAMVLTLKTAMEHGLAGVESVTTVQGPLFPAREKATQLHLSAGLWRGLSGEFQVPALHWPAPDSDREDTSPGPERLTLEGLEGTVSWRPGRTLSVSAQAKRISLLNEQRRWWLQLPELALSGERRGDWLDGSLLLQAGELRQGSHSLGPQQWQAQMTRFHGPSLGQVARSLDALYGRPAAPTRVAEAQARRSAFNQLSDALQRLSVHGGELNMGLQGGEQRLKGGLRLVYPALASPESQLPTSLIQHLRGQANLQLDPAYRQRLPGDWQQALNHWQKKDWLRPGPDGLSLEAELKDQTLTFNKEQQVELPPLL